MPTMEELFPTCAGVGPIVSLLLYTVLVLRLTNLELFLKVQAMTKANNSIAWTFVEVKYQQMHKYPSFLSGLKKILAQKLFRKAKVSERYPTFSYN